MIADRHIHTWFSTDSKEDPENSVRQAVKLGMKDIWITDHYDIDFPEGIFIFDVDDYFKKLTELKNKYEESINVHIGIELGLKTDIQPKIQALIDKYPFEYKIGSIHLMDNKDPYERSRFCMTDEQFYRMYFETTLECLKACSGFDTLGHLDYVVRYGIKQDESYSCRDNAELIDAILEQIIKKDIALEVNTAGVRKGLKYVHPYPYILKEYKAKGGRLLALGSDAHVSKDIGYLFEDTITYLNNIGLKDMEIL